ncbi:hypothetical protein PybrP1_001761, partial [[Pythium] brassicae (nom. inval.)]
MLRPRSLIIAALALVCAITSPVSAAGAADLDAFDVPTVDYLQLAASSESLLTALQTDGIVALKNIPQYEQLRAAYLLEATQCALAAGREGDAFLQHKTLNDGTKRFTISATAGKDLGRAVQETQSSCPGYAAQYMAFSQVVEGVVAALGKTLDATLFTISSHESLSGTELMSDSVHLDHFHAYEASPTAAAADDNLLSLGLHTDNGMLIAMSAPKYFDVLASSEVQQKTVTPYESGLLIENRAGKLVRPVLKEDELVLMVGSGFQEWIRSNPALRPVPHAMKYPRVSVSGERLIRAWFGKMVLLTPETRMLNVGMSFGAYAARTTRYLMSAEEHDSGFASLACPHGRRLHDNDKACVMKTCFPKPGKDPALACSIQCNLSEASRPGAERLCKENCDCEVKPGNATATYCWMLCSEQLPADQCKGVGQRCKTGTEAPYMVDQAYVCDVPTNVT